MQDVVLRIIETAPAPNRAWTSELWSGFPRAPGAALIAGAGASFTQAQLEAPGPGGLALDRPPLPVAAKRRRPQRPNRG
jgi:hypothetical protein